MEPATIKQDFAREDATRQENLDRARHCASLTKPWILPPQGWTENQKLPEPFSSLPSRGCSSLEGRLLLALFPANMPFFRLRPSGHFKFDPATDPAQLQEFQKILHLHELLIISKLERADKAVAGNSRKAGFRSRQRLALSQLLITGDVLTQLTDDFSLRVFRRDNYVTRRDTAGDVLFHIIRETIDPLALSEEQIAAAGYEMDELLMKSVDHRLTELFTKVEWNPLSSTWVVSQEINDNVVVEKEEKVTPFFSTPYSLAPGANYGEGLIGENLGDVRSINELTERILDFAALSSKMLFAVDYNSQVRPQDLAMPTGSVIQARVQQGQVTDLGMVKADKMQDFQVVAGTRDSIRKDLSSVMLMEGEQLPSYERASRLHVQRVAQEIEGNLGGVYAPIADSFQVPLVQRIRHVMTQSGDLPKLPDDAVEVVAVTGLEALSNESDKMKLMEMLQTIQQLGPEAMGRVNQGVLLEIIARQAGVYEPGLIKTEAELQAEIKAQQQTQMQATAVDHTMKAAAGRYEKTGELADPQGVDVNG